MPNEHINTSLEEAKTYLNGVETDGEVSINIADRILASCKSFVHGDKTKELDDFLNKIGSEFDMKLKEAKEKNDKESDSYFKYLNMAQFILNLRLEKTQRHINFLDRLNQKL